MFATHTICFADLRLCLPGVQMRTSERLGALLWVGCLQFFVAEQVTSRAWRMPYSFVRDYISDLGVIHCGGILCSPLHAVMNGSFVLQGILIGLGALLLWRRFNRMGRFGLGFLVVCGAGVLLVGFVPEDGNKSLHFWAAAAHFLGGGIGIGLVALSKLARAGLRTRGTRIGGWLSLLVGCAVLASTVLLGELGSLPPLLSRSPGVIERVAAYGITVWMLTSGWMAWRAEVNRLEFLP